MTMLSLNLLIWHVQINLSSYWRNKKRPKRVYSIKKTNRNVLLNFWYSFSVNAQKKRQFRHSAVHVTIFHLIRLRIVVNVTVATICVRNICLLICSFSTRTNEPLSSEEEKTWKKYSIMITTIIVIYCQNVRPLNVKLSIFGTHKLPFIINFYIPLVISFLRNPFEKTSILLLSAVGVTFFPSQIVESSIRLLWQFSVESIS